LNGLPGRKPDAELTKSPETALWAKVLKQGFVQMVQGKRDAERKERGLTPRGRAYLRWHIERHFFMVPGHPVFERACDVMGIEPDDFRARLTVMGLDTCDVSDQVIERSRVVLDKMVTAGRREMDRRCGRKRKKRRRRSCRNPVPARQSRDSRTTTATVGSALSAGTNS